MMMSQRPSEDSPTEAPNGKPSAKEIFTSPVFIIMTVILVIGIWFGSSFIATATNPTPENSINYYGVAEVLDVRSSPKKCYVDIRRDDGRETRQTMPRKDCGKFHVGDMITLENGQYVSTRP
jgi:hypothetical protein